LAAPILFWQDLDLQPLFGIEESYPLGKKNGLERSRLILQFAAQKSRVGYDRPSEFAYQPAVTVNGPRNEAVFMSCTDLRAVDGVQRVEDEKASLFIPAIR
jgi:maleate cis-trans isomerase